MKYFERLDEIDQSTSNTKEKGTLFEEMVVRRLEADPQYSDVWLWEDYPDRSTNDLGIDVVARDVSGDLWAFQCKNYASAVGTIHLGGFFLESSNADYAHRVLVAARGKFSRNLVSGIDRSSTTTLLRGPEWMTEFDLDWCLPLEEGRTFTQLVLKNHQLDAVSAVEKTHSEGRLAQMYLPCGSGKTVIMSELSRDKTFIFTAPSIYLVDQAYRAFRRQNPDLKAVIVCSDETAGREEKGEVRQIGDRVVRDAITLSSLKDTSVFVTYDSLNLVASSDLTFDIGLVDEAHKLVGQSGKRGHEIFNMDIDKIVFATATPRIVKKGADLEIISMDEHFGQVAYEMTLPQAVAQGLLVDYEILVIGITDAEVSEAMSNRSFVDSKGKSMTTDDVISLLAEEHAMRDFSITSALSYHTTRERAKNASTFLKDRGLRSDYVGGEMNQRVRRQKLLALKEHGGILCNARVLTEGIDIPALDGVFFADPKNSHVDIVQAAGRAMRTAEGKSKGYILVPAVISDTEHPEDGDYSRVIGLLRALLTVDETLAEEIDQIRTGKGRKRLGKVRFHGSSIDVSEIALEKIDRSLSVQTYTHVNWLFVVEEAETLGHRGEQGSVLRNRVNRATTDSKYNTCPTDLQQRLLNLPLHREWLVRQKIDDIEEYFTLHGKLPSRTSNLGIFASSFRSSSQTHSDDHINYAQTKTWFNYDPYEGQGSKNLFALRRNIKIIGNGTRLPSAVDNPVFRNSVAAYKRNRWTSGKCTEEERELIQSCPPLLEYMNYTENPAAVASVEVWTKQLDSDERTLDESMKKKVGAYRRSSFRLGKTSNYSMRLIFANAELWDYMTDGTGKLPDIYEGPEWDAFRKEHSV